ncbi:hypothetical protein Aduo_018539 [Ancylostoma duodenale]
MEKECFRRFLLWVADLGLRIRSVTSDRNSHFKNVIDELNSNLSWNMEWYHDHWHLIRHLVKGLREVECPGFEIMRYARILRKDAAKQHRRFLLALLVVMINGGLRRRRRRTYMDECHLDLIGWRFRCFETYLTSLNPDSFHVYTRFYPDEFENLYNKIAHRLVHTRNHITPISGRQRLTTLCRFLGHGSSFTYMSQELCLGASTVMNIVYEVAESIAKEFFLEVFPLPFRSTWADSASDFANMWNYPRGVAALDGKHFECFRPSHSGSTFFDYKGYYSIVLLALSLTPSTEY